jgi:predicted MFS family arabinose efflux permease
VSQDSASRSGWSAAVVGAVAVVCCLIGPALAGLLGGAVLWGVGLPVALVIAIVLAGACYTLLNSLRRRRRGSP